MQIWFGGLNGEDRLDDGAAAALERAEQLHAAFEVARAFVEGSKPLVNMFGGQNVSLHFGGFVTRCMYHSTGENVVSVANDTKTTVFPLFR